MDGHKKRFTFTLANVEKLPPSSGKAFDIYYDAKVDGLWLRVRPSGTKTFMVKRWVNNKAETVVLGRFSGSAIQSPEFEKNPLILFGHNPKLNVDQARRLAIAVLAQLNTGANPNQKLKQEREELTLAELFIAYMDRHAKKSRKTWQVMEKDFERISRGLRNKMLSAITHSDAERLHAQIAQTRGTYASNRAVQLLRAVYNKGKAWKLYAGDNPFSGITLFPEKPRERFLSSEEAGRLLAALADEPNLVLRDFITLSLLTGVRKSNLMRMRWDEIDMVSGKWTIPDTKNGTSQTIALNDYEIAILERRRASVVGEYVFPGSGKSGHLTDLKKSWYALRSRVGIDDCTIHDLRRSLGSGMAEAGVNVQMVKNVLHHKDQKTTLTVYSRTSQIPERQAREAAHIAWFESAGILRRNENPTLKRVK